MTALVKVTPSKAGFDASFRWGICSLRKTSSCADD